MSENYNFLFHYLEKEQILLDKTEFLFQLQSHPDYPTLLSIADTLSFFNIDNAAIRVDFSDLDLLPNKFITVLNNANSKPNLVFIEKKGESYFYIESKKPIEVSLSDLEKRWNGIVLLAEKTENEVIINPKNKFLKIIAFLSFFTFIFMLWLLKIELESKLFLIFPLLGVLLSIATLKDLFGTKSELINKFCNISATTSCNTVIGSTKWKFFEIVNFSDLSIVFFASQFLGLLQTMILGEVDSFFTIQKVFLIVALPLVLLSLYYQKWVEKKWCPLCLAIIVVLLLESILVFLIQDTLIKFSTVSYTVYAFVSLLIVLIWQALKATLNQQKELKEFQIKANRFKRDYEAFKRALVSKNSYKLIDTPIILGNKSSKITITIITHPFCKFCKDAHGVLDKILSKYENELQVKIIFKVDLVTLADDYQANFKSLLQIYFDKGEHNFNEALKDLFEREDLKKWSQIDSLESNDIKINEIYNTQNNWCMNNGFNYTPIIFINGYQYPEKYDREDLEFFINDLLEDQDFQ